MVWAGSGTLACTVSDTTVRCWEPHSGETYALSAQLPDLTAQTITCLAYSSNKGISVNSRFSRMITITTNTDKSKSWQKQIVSKLISAEINTQKFYSQWDIGQKLSQSQFQKPIKINIYWNFIHILIKVVLNLFNVQTGRGINMLIQLQDMSLKLDSSYIFY